MRLKDLDTLLDSDKYFLEFAVALCIFGYGTFIAMCLFIVAVGGN
jgi:hypothetical protein